jgi:hypothetical protein
VERSPERKQQWVGHCNYLELCKRDHCKHDPPIKQKPNLLVNKKLTKKHRSQNGKAANQLHTAAGRQARTKAA